MRRTVSISIGFLLLAGCSHFISLPNPQTVPPVPEISHTLLDLVNKQEDTSIKAEDYYSDSFIVVRTLGTPMGYRLKLRYAELGISLVEGLKLSHDRLLLDRLFELAKWSNNLSVRAEALVTIANFSDPRDIVYFQTALLDKDVGVRCAAVEAVELWGRPEGIPILRKVMADPWSPLLQIFAAKALLVQGDASAIPTLIQGLESRSWIIRALAARYLGDYGSTDQIKILYAAFQRETSNDFVAAELAISTLKLLAKNNSSPSAVPLSAPASAKTTFTNQNFKFWYGNDNTIEMEPLTLNPPRVSLEESTQISSSINDRLIFFLQNRLGIPLSTVDDNNPDVQNLYTYLTPRGYSLQTRYANLSVVVAEGLAGTNDPFLRQTLVQLADGNRNSLTQATALLSLAYNNNMEDYIVINHAFNSDDPIVRFAALEAAQIGRFDDAIPDLMSMATSDPIPAFQLFAIQVLLKMDHPAAHNLLLTHLSETDWVARAMAFWYMGRYGNEEDFETVLSRIPTEDNLFVKSEMALAAQRLRPNTP